MAETQLQDAGGVENRLSLNPNDERWAEALASWEDGEEYELTVRVKQVSPGEFEVIDASPEEATEAPPEAEEEMEGEEVVPQATAPPRKGIANPAVQAALAKRRP